MPKVTIIVCVLVAVCAVTAFDDETQKKIKELIFNQAKECVGKSQPTKDDLAQLKQHVVPETETGKCFLKCILVEFGVIADGKYSKKGALAAALPFIQSDDKRATVEGVIDKCAAEMTATNECDLARDAVLCTQKYKNELGVDMMDIEF